jgi:hypothetical protein
LRRKKARKQRQPTREDNQGIGNDRLYDNDKGPRVGLLGRGERAHGIESSGVIDKL